MTPTPAGKFKDTVTITPRVPIDANELGELVPVHNPTGYPARAYIRPLTAREVERNAAVDMDATHEVRIRYRPGVFRTDTLTYQGRRLDVVGIVDVENAHRELILTCNEAT